MRDLPPIVDVEAPSSRPRGGPGTLVPACVLLREDGSLELKPLEGASIEERELTGRAGDKAMTISRAFDAQRFKRE